jgi:hypothetical protein
LIRPEPGKALAYVDYEQQEFGIAAALSGDRAMMDAYTSGDPYLTFAKQAGAVPLDGTTVTHKAERERFKVLSLAVQYGMGAESLARILDESPARGRELIGLHRRTYPRYWQWSDDVEMTAFLSGKLQTAFGWRIHVGPNANPRSLRNFPLQGNGAEMLRIACILATERGIRVCAPIHDALLIESEADEIGDAVAAMQAAMREAGEIVLSGFRLRTDAKIVRYPDRYFDPRGERFWRTVWELIGENTCCAGATPTPSARATKLVAPALPPSSIFLSSVFITSKKDGPPDGPGTIPIASGDDCAAQTETASALPSGIPARADPVAVAHASDDVTGPRLGRGADPVAGSGVTGSDDGPAIASPVAGEQNQPLRRAARVAFARASRVSGYSSAARPLLGSDDNRPAGGERDAELSHTAEREAIKADGCALHTLAELATAATRGSVRV